MPDIGYSARLAKTLGEAGSKLSKLVLGDPSKNLSPEVSAILTQARAARHNQSLPAALRQSQTNQDLDHYAVGNEMAGPQFPLHERLGAIPWMIGHEVLRPALSASKSGGITKILNAPFGDQPPWIAEGEGAGGAAAEPPVDFSGAMRNLRYLASGALGLK